MKRFYSLFLCWILIIPAFAQNKATKTKLMKAYLSSSSLGISILNAGIGMPPHFINGRLQLGSEINLHHPLKLKRMNRYFDYKIGLGYFAQQSLQRNTYIKPSIGYSFKCYRSVYLRPSLHTSFMLVRQTNDEFIYQGNGLYEPANRYRFQLMPSFGLESFFHITALKKLKLGGLLKYEFGAQLPFSNLSSILPINQLHLGIYLKK